MLEFKYGQSGTGVGQPCGYTSEQIIQFAVDPRMVALPHIVEEATEDKIWKSVETALKKLIEEDLGKAGNDKGAGKGKEVVEGGVGQATGDAQFGGGKRAKTGIVAIPECQDAALLAKQV